MAGNNLTLNNNPYVGPRTFMEKDARLFFGREREARDLLSLVVSEPLTLFYARSGAGKSSLINARLIPGLREEEFTILPAVRVSGTLPVGVTDVDNIFVFNLLLNLDQNKHDPQTFAHETLADHFKHRESQMENPDQARVLIIDQFEEIFTTHLDRWQERKGFFEQLAQVMKQDHLLWVVLAMREDYVASLDPFARMLPGRLRPRFFMQRMDEETALAAIEEPARQGGRPFAPGVARTLVDNLRQIRGLTAADVIQGQFVEPVQLQVVCYQLWEKLQTRPQAEITAQDVKELGDVDQALGHFYEQALERVVATTGITELVLRNWFERELITESYTRGNVYQGKETTAGMPNEAVRQLVNQFLLRSEFRAGGTWYELGHDRFVEPVLQSNNRWRLQQSPLVQAAEVWERAGRPKEKLYRGGLLRETLTQINPESSEEPVKSFLKASQDAQNERDLAQAQEKAAEEQRRAEKEARTAARLRYLATALIAALVLVAAASVVAFWQSQEASTKASENATLAVENAVAVVTSDYFAVEANYLAQTAVASEAEAEAAATTSADLAKENASIALTSQASEAIAATRAYEAEEAKQLALESQQQAEMQRCIVLAQALASQALLTLNQPQNDTELATLLAIQASSLPCVDADSDTDVFNLANTVLQDVMARPYYNNILQQSGPAVRALAFSQDGRWLAAAGDNATAQLYDLTAPGSDPILLLGHSGVVRAVAFNPQTNELATAGDDTVIRIWDSSSPAQPILELFGHTEAVRTLAFSLNGQTLYSGGDDEAIRAWDLSSADSLNDTVTRVNHLNGVFDVAFFQTSSQFLLVSGSSEAIYLWDVNRFALTGPLRLSSSQRFINSLAVNRTGRLLATVGSDAAVRLWDITNSGTIPTPVTINLNVAQIGGITFNPTNSTLFVADSTGTIRLWDLPRFVQNPGLADVTLTGPQSFIADLAVNAEGTLLASAAANGEIRLWRLQPLNLGDDVSGEEPLFAAACVVVRRNFTLAEWNNYLPGQVYQPTCLNLPANN